MTPIRRRLLTLIACALASCRSEDLAPRETFHWTDQAISFAPPAEGWRREGELSGGVRGVRFVKERSVGEAVTIGEFHHVAERSRTKKIQDLFTRLDEMEWRQFSRASQLAQSRTDAYSKLEAAVAEEVNGALLRARIAFMNGDRSAARADVKQALDASRRLKFTLDDVLETAARDIGAFPRRKTEVAGEPAVAIEWTFAHSGRTYARREVFFMHDSHLFVARFIGLEKTVPLFDRVVASIEFGP